MRELYQRPTIREVIFMDHIKGHYFSSHPTLNTYRFPLPHWTSLRCAHSPNCQYRSNRSQHFTNPPGGSRSRSIPLDDVPRLSTVTWGPDNNFNVTKYSYFISYFSMDSFRNSSDTHRPSGASQQSKSDLQRWYLWDRRSWTKWKE